MRSFKVRVEHGQIVGPAPPGLPDGAELERTLAEPGDDLAAEDLPALNDALDEGWRDVSAGQLEPCADVLHELRSMQ